MQRPAGRHDKTFESVLGPVTPSHAYYHPESCGAGFCSRDQALDLDDGSLSPAVLRMVGRVGAMVGFEEGHQLLAALAGVDVPTKHVERAAEALGREIVADERCVVEAPVDATTVASTIYLGMDGTGLPVRKEELVDRPGKQLDGTAKTREAKRATAWSAEGRDKEGRPVRAQGLCVGSGVVEAGCKRPGMHWTVAGVNAIIALRCCQPGGRFERFSERRAAFGEATG